MKKILLILLLLITPLTVNAESHYLYDVLKDEAENNGLAKEYTGEHHDSFTEEPSKKIYHWYSESDNDSTEIKNKWNVLFGGFCWQMLRTTDTGGVKLLYNGVQKDNNCYRGMVNRIIGSTSFNEYNQDFSPADVGYMYNERYILQKKYLMKKEDIFKGNNLSTDYWYSDTISYDPSTYSYSLVNPYKISSTEEYPNLIGKYTLFQTSESDLQRAYYISAISDSTAYTINLTSGKTLDQLNYQYVYGTSYTQNQDGTYTINNPSTLNRADYYQDGSILHNKFVCKTLDNNSTCNELWKIVSTGDKKEFSYLSSNKKVIFSNDVIFENGQYSLNNDRVEIWDITNEDNLTSINSHHYTCWDTSGACEKVSYVANNIDYEAIFNYMELSEGKRINDALDEMFYADDVNKNDSTIKSKIDNWYNSNLISYNDYLEDTVFCNKRTINNLNNTGFNPNGGNIKNKYLFYYVNSGLKCPNVTDMFSMSNNKAKLKHPIGLPTYDEIKILGDKSLTKTSNDYSNYWLMSPSQYDFDINWSKQYKVLSSGIISDSNTATTTDIRPSISLNPRIKYISGNGSEIEPYIIDYTNYYGIDVEINDETEDLTVEINDLSQVEEGETVNFKVTPIKGHRVTSIRIIDENNEEVEYNTTDNKNFVFTMPSSDVTIIPSYERVKNAVNVEDNKNTKEFVIEVNDSKAVVYEDTVKFRVEPEAGYEVESIDITDKENNKINYKKTSNKNEYEFIMPDTDVLIKPYYRLISSSNLPNPNTKRQVLLIVISVIILGIMTTLFIKRKGFRYKV